MVRLTLTPAEINAAPAGATLLDSVVPGLRLRVFAGSRAWYLYYRTRGGKRRQPKLGEWPALAIPKARKIARTMLDEVAAGGDPQGQRAADRVAPTVSDLCDRYMLEHGDKKKSAVTDTGLIRRLVKPRLGTERVADLDYDRINAWHKSHPHQVQANRALALLSTALNLAERWGWRPIGSNPCRHVSHHKEQRRRRYMTLAEAARISAGLAAHAAKRPQAIAFLYLLIYTGARKSEIAAAKWDNLQGGAIRLPDSKSGHPRVIHLPAQVTAILAALPRINGETICGIASPKRTWKTIRETAGCPDLRMHDLRHSFASAALAAGLNLAQIGELLGHQSAQTTKGYAHLMDDIARASAATTADLIEARLTGKT